MPLNTFLDFSTTASSNVDVAGIGIQGTNAVQNFDNAFRELMAILRRDLDNGMVLTSKSAGYTAVATDNNAVIRFSAAATLSLTAAATLGADWHCWVMADGGAVVIDPNASETINGAATITIPDGYSTLVICDGTNFRALEDYATVSTALSAKQDNSGELYRGLLNGLTLSNNATDATNDIDIATGSAGSDGTTPVLMTLSSALTKRLDATWAVGSGNGGLDTGTIANTTYHVWLIQRSDTGVVDALFSTSATSPTMPSSYDRKRRIGSIIRESAAIVAFRQNGDLFLRTRATPRTSTSAFSSALLSVNVPTGINVRPLLVNDLRISASSTDVSISMGSGTGSSADRVVQIITTGAATSHLHEDLVHVDKFTTNTNGEIYYAATINTGSIALNSLFCDGWIDARGQ